MKRLFGLTASMTIIVAGSILTGCNLNSVNGSGEIQTQTRDVPAFSGLIIKGSADATITMGTSQSLEITTDDNILSILTTEVSDGVLTLDSKESYSATEGVTLTITVPQMELVEIKGSGDVTVNGNSVESLIVPTFTAIIDGSGSIEGSEMNATATDATIKGSGEIRLSGQGSQLQALVSGSGEILADEFQTQSVDATINGSGEIHVNVQQSLEASISGSGTIFYRGDPSNLITNVSGSGDIIKR